MKIAVYQNGCCIGYVKRVSTYYGKVDITQDATKAKKYRTFDQVAGDIDLCTAINPAWGYMQA